MRKLWSQEEKEYLLENYGAMDIKDLVEGWKERFGYERSYSSITNQAKQLGVKNNQFWTDEEEELIKENYRKIDIKDLAKLIEEKTGKKRTVDVIRYKAHRLKVTGERCDWSEEEQDLMKACYERLEMKQIQEKLFKVSGIERSIGSIQNKASKMGLRSIRPWSEDEIQCLETWFGNTPLPLLAQRVTKISGVERSEDAVHRKLLRMGLSDSRQNTGKLTAQDLAKTLDVAHQTVTNWIKSGLLKGEYRPTMRVQKYWLIKVEDFWKFAAKNKEKIDFSKIEPLTLIPEPEWFEEARKHDFHHYPKRQREDWTPEEEHKLITMYKQKLSLEEIAATLRRKVSGIKVKIYKLKNSGHIHRDVLVQLPWREVEIELMYELEKQGLHDPEIAEELGRTEAQVSSKRRRLKEAGKYKGFKNRKVGVKNA